MFLWEFSTPKESPKMRSNPTSLSSNEKVKSIPTLKVCVIGASGLGKTTWVKRLATGDFTWKHIPTLGVEVHPLTLRTNHGPVIFNLWDVAGLDKYRGLGDGYFIQSHGAILFLTSDVEDNKRRLLEFRRINSGDTPVVCVIPKCDVPRSMEESLATHGMQKFAKANGLLIYPMSAKSNYNFEKPLLAIASALFKVSELRFVDEPIAPSISPKL
jgi:GTP-binding nuclear protein Ran